MAPGRLAAAFAVASVLMLTFPQAQAAQAGYWDATGALKGKGREPLLVEYDGQLWCIYQFRTELKDTGINQSGRRSDIYYTVLNASAGNGPARSAGFSDWSAPVSLVPKSQDVNGHGVHGPFASVYKGKLYVTMEAVETSIKDDTLPGPNGSENNSDYDILLRVFDGNVWDPPLDGPARVISGRNDVNVSDTECRSIAFRDTLYFIWDRVPVDVGAGDQPLAGMRQMVYRTFDGASWGPVTLAARENSSIFSVPSVAVYRDALWVSFSTNSSEQADTDIDVIRYDGVAWSAPQRVNPAVEGSTVRRQNMNSRLCACGDRLYCAWQSADPIAKSGSDYDILVSTTDGASGWSAPFEVNPPGDSDAASLTGQDITPDVKVYNGTLYVSWASNSTRINDGGEDYDIMLRPFNGTGWGPITQASPAGDNGTIGGDHNVGDDNTPWLLAWNGSFYSSWISYDQGGVGHKGGNPSVIVKRLFGPAAAAGPGEGDLPVENRETSPPAQSVWPFIAVAVLAAAAVVGAFIVRFSRRRRERPGTQKKEE
jgi:hypothetical protein